jgi:hypothetical protein
MAFRDIASSLGNVALGLGGGKFAPPVSYTIANSEEGGYTVAMAYLSNKDKPGYEDMIFPRLANATQTGRGANFGRDTFVFLMAASGPRDELQAAASGMTVGKLDVFLSVAEIGDNLAHAASRSTVWSQFVDNS